MSDLWVRTVPKGLSLPKALRFRLDARALTRAEELSLLRADRAELMPTIGRLPGGLDDALQMVGELAANQVHPRAETCVGDGRWRRSA